MWTIVHLYLSSFELQLRLVRRNKEAQLNQPHVKFLDRDYSNEPTSLTLYLPDITPINFESTRDSTVLNLQAVLMDVSHLNWSSYDLIVEVHPDVGTLPASPYAQRERRAIFTCIDNATGSLFDVGVPAPDMDDTAIAGTDVIPLSQVDVAAYVAALELLTVSPDGNSVTVVKGVNKGRNN